MARIGLIALGGGTLLALTVGGLIAVAPSLRSHRASEPELAAAATAPSPEPAADAPALAPAVAEGHTELGGGIFAQRAGTEVVVHFDTDTLRTRLDSKFEGVVRSTLPTVFGPEARVALDSLPPGRLVRGGSLLVELPSRGIRLPLAAGRVIMIWPVTRPGQDGPLVVAYRAVAK